MSLTSLHAPLKPKVSKRPHVPSFHLLRPRLLSLSLRRAWPSLICVGPWAHDGEAIFDADGGMSTAQHERERENEPQLFLFLVAHLFWLFPPPLDSCSLRPALVTAGPDGIFLVKKGLAKRFVPSSQPIGSFGSLSLSPERDTARDGPNKVPRPLFTFFSARPSFSFFFSFKEERNMSVVYILRSISIYSLKGRAPFLVLVSSLFF